MEKNSIKTVWVLTSARGCNSEFVRVYETRDEALKFMRNWQNNFIESGVFESVSKIDSVYYSVISFEVTDRCGRITKIYAREEKLF